MKKIISIILTVVTLLFGTTTVFATEYSFSIEDLYIYFETNSLPSWSDIRTTATEEIQTGLEKEQREFYSTKKALASAVMSGFKKSSEYSTFKADVEKCSAYDSEYQELIPIGYSETEESTDYKKNERELESARSRFDKAMSQAAVRDVFNTNTNASRDNWLVYQMDRLTNALTGTVYGLIGNIDRIALTLMSLQLTAELVYLSVDMSRPILGFEGIAHRRKVRLDQEDGYYLGSPKYEYVDDHSRHFRLVGRAARIAVEQEYKINDDMASAVKNDIFKCYLYNKLTQIIMIVLSIAIVYTNLWGEIMVWIIGILSGI